MFGISLAELLVIALIAIFFVKPQDLPEIARFLGKIYAKIRRLINEFKKNLAQTQKEMGIDEIKHEFNAALVEDEIKSTEKKTKIVDIYGNIHEVGNVNEIRSDLNSQELEEEVEKYNKINEKTPKP